MTNPAPLRLDVAAEDHIVALREQLAEANNAGEVAKAGLHACARELAKARDDLIDADAESARKDRVIETLQEQLAELRASIAEAGKDKQPGAAEDKLPKATRRLPMAGPPSEEKETANAAV